MRYQLDFFVILLLLLLVYFGLVAPKIKKYGPKYYAIAGWLATILLFIAISLFEYFTDIDIAKTIKKFVGDSFCYFHTVASCPVEIRDWAAKRAAERAEAERKHAAEIAETERKRAAEEAVIKKAAAAERLAKEEALRARREASMRELESFETKRRESELAKQRADEDAWLSATRPETIGGLKRYLRQHLLGRYAGNARASIAALEEEGRRERDRVLREADEDAWRAATRPETVEGLKGYLRQFPKGSYAAWARTSIAELELMERRRADIALRRADEDAWIAASRPESVDGLNKYLQQFPRGEYAVHAKLILWELEFRKRYGPRSATERSGARATEDRSGGVKR